MMMSRVLMSSAVLALAAASHANTAQAFWGQAAAPAVDKQATVGTAMVASESCPNVGLSARDTALYAVHSQGDATQQSNLQTADQARYQCATTIPGPTAEEPAAILHYGFDAEKQQLHLAIEADLGENGWMSLAFPTTGRGMAPADAVIAYRPSATEDYKVGTFAVNGLARFFIQPDEQALLSSGLEMGTRPNGRTLLYFTRNLANGGRVSIDPESTVAINYAYGTGPEINYHGPRARGLVRVPINRVVVKPMATALNELGVEAPVEAKTAISEEPLEPLDAEMPLDDAEMPLDADMPLDAEMDAMLEASGVDAAEMDAVAEEAVAEEAAAVAESEPESEPEAQPEVQITWEEEESAPGIPLAEDALAELDAAVKIEEEMMDPMNDELVKEEAMSILSTIDEMSSQEKNSCPDTMARLEKLENDFDMLKKNNIKARQEARERVATQQEVNSRIVHEIAVLRDLLDVDEDSHLVQAVSTATRMAQGGEPVVRAMSGPSQYDANKPSIHVTLGGDAPKKLRPQDAHMKKLHPDGRRRQLLSSDDDVPDCCIEMEARIDDLEARLQGMKNARVRDIRVKEDSEQRQNEINSAIVGELHHLRRAVQDIMAEHKEP
ncbi:hypothetical protein PPROV_000302100 [Pycnococcus provasolii]|uniref:DOMON domain-containing protein n=1 Tax=Pycnococcus provasolii TaxID=41880 RepID=A0A830HGQ7_9CHLO|nr:hypothetical protein PPROV_000302100 [Pycnococcus provasolii]|mmetsp:Transcript_4766/g.12429  ORF Transcript_4766/g.12429 Transcript_4766/m.12429 type:complete len:611 (+) Transcript_4766:120-1952(+)|eukprot:CAMPEP_0205955502 /NCGR_PEP_ID=MMETSP1459-20131121/31706_1 /ASSEMBLY_ACC=CAM_ASM_001120 /TAXON_ID=41880 /ORGANISM="Pycnococcus provasolii, Strain RCC931" /LENGTH=610 /DNA_ID=CAMNT_0053327839 /DNA_START=55 /DNA_END=1887 /DNA_ORIENTATION=+